MSGPDGNLHMGLSGVGWEANNNTGPLLFRNVNEAELVSVKAKISSQTSGNWSLAGVIVRMPNPLDAADGTENWQTAWSFRPGTDDFRFQSNSVTAGVEAEVNNAGLTVDDLQYLRLDNLGGGMFQAYRGSGPEEAIVWTSAMDANMMPAPQTNVSLSSIPLQVGVAGGALGELAGSSVLFDWVEIETTTQTLRDDFDYNHDFATGVPGGQIWDGVENAPQRCVTCNWDIVGSGDFANPSNWDPTIGFTPDGNDVTAIFGDVLDANMMNVRLAPTTVYTNQNTTLKELRLTSAITYAIGGAGSFTLESDSGNALINVEAGSHEIQADLLLNDNVMATAAAGATLDINAAVVLNGHTFMTAGPGTINLNNGQVVVGSGAGGGGLVNDGNLSGLGGVAGDFAQTGAGSLAVEAGGSVAQVLGSAELGGTLDVSLAAGFEPTLGQSYTVLTASSVTNLGLSLTGSAANLFDLAVGPGSVSLVAVAIPEPATLLLVSLGLVLGVFVRRQPDRDRSGVHYRMLRSWCALAALFTVGASVACADTLTFGTTNDPEEPVTYRDEFSSFFDYYGGGGSVPASTLVTSTPGATTKSWTAVYNETNGNDPSLFPPIPFVANGMDENGMPRPDALYITDTGFHPNTDTTLLGVGWESTSNNAPFLLANVKAEDSFDAIVKINDQTGGTWSYGGLLARHAGPPHGLGYGDALDPTEAMVTMGTFRTAADNPDTMDVNEQLNATILTQNVGQFDADSMNDPDEQETQAGGAANGLPIWLRMSKNGAQFESATSLDGITWTVRNTVFNQQLNVEGELLEVGPMFQMYPNPSTAGHIEFEYFEVTVRKTQRPLDATWASAAANVSGNWNTATNWSSMTLAQAPDNNATDVTFGDANATSGPATIYTNRPEPNVVRSITFNSPNTYAISGLGGIMLEPDPQSLDDVDRTYINVQSGSHQIDVPLSISGAALNDNVLSADAGGKLDINNSFNLNGKQVTVSGAGRININNNIDTGTTGTLNVFGGNLGGSGRINGGLVNGNASNPGGTVSPGTSVGKLTVDGTINQHASGTMLFELGGTGAGEFDVLEGTGLALLSGNIDVSLVDGFVPQVDDMFEIIKAATNIVNSGISLVGADDPYYDLIVTNSGSIHTVALKVVEVPPGDCTLVGDFSCNGAVENADLTLLLNNWAQPAAPVPAGWTGIPQPTQPSIDNDELTALLNNWGKSLGSGSAAENAATAPEPGTALMTLLFAGVLLGTARTKCRIV